MTMNSQQWKDVHALAAELVAVHRTDANHLRKIVHHLRSEHMDYQGLHAWLDAKITYAAFFPRSQQTLDHDLAARAVVEFIAEQYSQDTDQITEMLGWVARLMIYYVQNKAEANRRADPRAALLNVPRPDVVRLKVRPPRRSGSTPESKNVQSSEPSDFAEQFMKFLKGKQDS